MKKAYVFMANGFEDIEALAPIDILRRGGVHVTTVSINDNREVESAHGVTILDGGKVRFGDHVLVGPGCQFLTACHPVDAAERARWLVYHKPITVGDNVWFGAGVIVMPGVTIGDRSVIGAGSIVTKDIPSDVVAAGNPCRVLRPITEDDQIL